MQAAALKMAAAKKKGKGAKDKPKVVKEAPKVEIKKEEPEEPVLDKKEQKRVDTERVLAFCDEIQAVKNRQVSTVFEVLRAVN